MQAMASDLGEDYSTVRKWFQRRRVPERVWPLIISKSAKSDQPVSAEILLKLNGPRKKRAA